MSESTHGFRQMLGMLRIPLDIRPLHGRRGRLTAAIELSDLNTLLGIDGLAVSLWAFSALRTKRKVRGTEQFRVTIWLLLVVPIPIQMLFLIRTLDLIKV